MAELTIAHAAENAPPEVEKHVKIEGETVKVKLAAKEIEFSLQEAKELAELLPELRDALN
jgi:hypothetical protein